MEIIISMEFSNYMRKSDKSNLYTFKVGLLPSKKVCFICFNESPLKMMENVFYITLCISLKAFDDFENQQKSVWSSVFWYVKVCIFWKCI